MAGGRSKRDRIYVYVWLIHFVIKQKLTQHCKATITQFRKKKGNCLPVWLLQAIISFSKSVSPSVKWV